MVARAATAAGEQTHVVYLCYKIVANKDANTPFTLKPVLRFEGDKDYPGDFPCYSSNDTRRRPILRGDRLRVAIDVDGADAEAFLRNVSVIGLYVTLTAAPLRAEKRSGSFDRECNRRKLTWFS